MHVVMCFTEGHLVLLFSSNIYKFNHLDFFYTKLFLKKTKDYFHNICEENNTFIMYNFILYGG
jgi:hypothetical protein